MYRDTLSSYSTRSIGTSPQPAMAPKRRVADAAVVAQRQRLLRLLERQLLRLHVDRRHLLAAETAAETCRANHQHDKAKFDRRHRLLTRDGPLMPRAEFCTVGRLVASVAEWLKTSQLSQRRMVRSSMTVLRWRAEVAATLRRVQRTHRSVENLGAIPLPNAGWAAMFTTANGTRQALCLCLFAYEPCSRQADLSEF